jgi:hypothetical protein
VDQWGFEVFGHRIHVSCIEIPQENVFPANSISIDSRWTNGVSSFLGAGFVFPASSYPRITCFRRTRFSLVPGPPMGFRGEWTFDSDFPYRVTARSIKLLSVSYFVDNVLLTRLQTHTNKQKNFFFVRPSFQSRECFEIEIF